MYSENLGKDVILFCRAFLSNQFARFSPKLYVNLTHQTGRGGEEEGASGVANYFVECFHDYRKQLGLSEKEFQSYLNGKEILEYGPGDILGVALLFYAYGAKTVHCVDRFPLSKMSKTNRDVYIQLVNSLGGKQRERAENAFKDKGDPEGGFGTDAIRYNVTPSGLSEATRKYDLIISRAVLEHVDDLEAKMLDIKRSMRNDGLSLHKVDLESHGLDRYIDFDFLTWPRPVYEWMYGHKGFPNRWRVNTYKELAERSNLRVKTLIPTGRLPQEKLDAVILKVAKEFRRLSPEELSWQGFWMHLEHAPSRTA